MAAPDDWLKRIGSLLQADTLDLRALALAAGKDPATFYIGTNLDGVDIRGQDLRGMQLPGLDLNRVQRDGATQVDGPPPDLAAPEARPLDLVWVAAGRDAVKRIKLPFEVAIYGPDDQDEFLHLAQSANGGPVMLVGSTTDIGLVARFSNRLAALAVPFVTILDERLPFTFDQHGRFRLAQNLPPPVVVIPRPATPWPRTQAVSAEAMDAAGLLMSEWGWRDELSIAPTTYFVRARGIGANRHLDAAAQLSDRLEAEGLPLERISLVRFRDDIRRDEDAGVFALLQPSPALIPYRGRRRNFDLALFVDPAVEQQPSAYLRRTANALATRGWEARYGPGAELRIINDVGSFNALFVREPDAPDQIGAPPPNLPGVSFDDAEELILTPRADISRIARHLVTERRFLVTGRDLLALPKSATSVWLIVAHQLSQISKTLPGRARDLYIRCVLASAFKQSNVDHSGRTLLRAIAEDPNATGAFKLSVVTYKAVEGSATARLRVLKRSTADLVTEADLLVDSRGVHVTHPSPPPALRVPHESKPILVSPLFEFIGEHLA